MKGDVVLSYFVLRLLKLLLEEPETHWYGFAISKRMNVDINTVYMALHRLKKAEWLETYPDPEDPIPNMVPRKMYRFTSLGQMHARAALVPLQTGPMALAAVASAKRRVAARA